MPGVNLLYIFLHESSNAELDLSIQLIFLKIVTFCEKQCLSTKMSDFK